MIAQNVAMVPPEMKAPPAPLPGGQSVGTFVNHFATATAANLNAASNLTSSTALSTSSYWHKLAAKNDNASSNSSPAPSQANQTPPPQNNQTPATPATNTTSGSGNGNNNASNATNASTGATTTTPVVAPSSNVGQVQVAAALGTGATIQLGSAAQTSFANQFALSAGAGSPQTAPGQANATASAPNAAASSGAPAQTGTVQTNIPATLLAQSAAGAANTASTLNPPQGLPLPQSAAAQAAALAANQAGATTLASGANPPTGTSARVTTNQPGAIATVTSQNAGPASSANAGQVGVTSASVATTTGASPDNTPAHPGAAELNARVVAGATTLIAQSNAAAVSSAKDLMQPSANASAAVPSSTATTVPLDKAHGTSGIATGGADSAPANAAATPSNQIADLHGLATALARSPTGHDATSDVSAGDAKQSIAPSADGTTPSPASSNAATTAQANSPADSSATAGPDASLRPTLAALPASEQVAIHLKQAAQNGTNEIQIQLKPASLGAIDVKLNVNHDGRLTAVISADRSDTLNLLKQDAGSLQQSLRDAGFSTDSGSLSFNLRGDPQSFAQNGSQQGGNTTGFTTPLNDEPVAKIAAYALRQHTGTIDIQA